MADDADKSDAHSAELMTRKLDNIRKAAASIPEGKPGTCKICGWTEAPRLVKGVCTLCRDKHGLG